MKAVLVVLAACLLYYVIKGAVKSAILESRRELNYIIRKALLDEKADARVGAKDIPDYTRQGF